MDAGRSGAGMLDSTLANASRAGTPRLLVAVLTDCALAALGMRATALAPVSRYGPATGSPWASRAARTAAGRLASCVSKPPRTDTTGMSSAGTGTPRAHPPLAVGRVKGPGRTCTLRRAADLVERRAAALPVLQLQSGEQRPRPRPARPRLVVRTAVVPAPRTDCQACRT